MKRFLLSFFSFVVVLSAMAETYTYKFANGDLKTDAGVVTLGDYEWNASAANQINWNANGKGIQIGSKAAPCASYTLSTKAFSDFTIKSVTVNSSNASSGDAKLTIKVGDKTSDAFSLTTSDAPYTFTCDDASGEIVINWTASQRAYYVSQITVEYQLPADMVEVPAPVFKTTEGVYADEITVEAATSDEAAILFYTIDGTEPSYEDYLAQTGTTKRSGYYVLYQKLTESATIKAMAVLTDGDAVYKSKVTEASYIISATKPYQQASAVASGSKYGIIAADSVAMPLAADKSYGYLYTDTVKAKGGYVETVEYFGFTFESADGGYTIKDVNGRYLYMTGNYNSFNVSETLPEEGAVWSVEIAQDGAATIKNVAKDKTIYYSLQYSSFGCYAADKVNENMVLPKLYLQREYPEATVVPADNSVLDKFQTITISCPLGIKAADDLKVEVLGMEGDNIMKCRQVDANTIEFSLDAPVIADNNMTLMVYFTGDILLEPDGMAVPMVFKNRRLMYIVMGDAPAATIKEVNPADGATVEKLSYILFTFSYYVGATEDASIFPKLHREGSDELIPVEFTLDTEDGTGKVAHMDGALRVTEPITANGNYILEVPAGYFVDSNGRSLDGITLKYTVKNDGTGIDDVEAAANGYTVYSLQGVKVMETTDASRLNALPAGVYIVNGTKVLVK
ncbi:MAG: chitobiase/beta-hexosaminidase C-terminal domain-containing protein [Bacteroidaceae bacterium]|nr:chitobiase/beta-hexosaminidase C-terminal domain-containing protein [Bacteroidaceae bacterium]